MSSQAYIIEIGSDAVGIVVREAGEASFQFHSALSAYRSLDGKKFATARRRTAQRSITAHIAPARLLTRAACRSWNTFDPFGPRSAPRLMAAGTWPVSGPLRPGGDFAPA